MIFPLFRRMPLALALCLLATACINPPRTADLSPPSFKTSAPILLEVSDIQVRSEYQPRMDGVESRFPTSPEQGVHRWADERLKAVGTSGVLEVVIHDAGVTEKPLVVKSGLEGALTKQPNVRYDGTLTVSLNLYTPEQSTAKARADASVSVSRELMEKATESERKELFAAMTREMLTRLDTRLDSGIQQYFSNYIAR